MIKIEVGKDGMKVSMILHEQVDLKKWAGAETVNINRVSLVEFDNTKQRWFVASARTKRLLRDDFLTREEAIAWEKQQSLSTLEDR